MNQKNNFELVESKLARLASPGIRPGLARLARLMRELGFPQKKFHAVHVVGTNGKGSTAAGIYSVLRASGCRTALYTSPHLVDFSERLEIDGEQASARLWLEAAAEIERAIEQSDYFHDNLPTYFEIVTSAAILILSRKNIDIAVFEAGMGGRLDATNILTDVALSVVVPIGMDHTDFLGESIEKIAAEKFAVVRRGTPALFAGDARLDAQFKEAATSCGALPYIFTEEYSVLKRECTLSGTRFVLAGKDGAEEYFTPLAGAFQAENAAMAVVASRLLAGRFDKISDESIKLGISQTVWPGRMEILRRDPLVIIDGAHNSHAMARFAEAAAEFFPRGGVSAVVAMMKDKDISNALSLLRPLDAKIFCTELPNLERSLSAEAMRQAADSAGLSVAGAWADPIEAIRAALRGGSPVLCCGSLFLAGYIKERKDELQRI